MGMTYTQFNTHSYRKCAHARSLFRTYRQKFCDRLCGWTYESAGMYTVPRLATVHHNTPAAACCHLYFCSAFLIQLLNCLLHLYNHKHTCIYTISALPATAVTHTCLMSSWQPYPWALHLCVWACVRVCVRVLVLLCVCVCVCACACDCVCAYAKITCTVQPTNRFVSTTKISIQCVVNWILLRIGVRSRNTQPNLKVGLKYTLENIS